MKALEVIAIGPFERTSPFADGLGLGRKDDAFVTRAFQFRDGKIEKGGGIAPTALHSKSNRSGRRRDVVAFFLGLGFAGPATRLGLFRLAVIVTGSDRRRKDAERNSLLAFAVLVAAGTIRAIPLRPISTLASETVPLRPLGPVAALLGARPDIGLAVVVTVLGLRRHFLVALGLILVVVAARAALRLLLLESRAAVLQHAEVMIRILEIIFGLDAVAGKLGVARQALVFFEQLSGVAALAIITGVAGIAGHSLRTLSTAATTTAALTIIDQMYVPCRTGAGQAGRQNLPSIGSVVPRPRDRPASHDASRPFPAVKR